MGLKEMKNQRQFFKEWLEKLQQESWQLELLISGLALIGIYSARDWIHDYAIYVDLNSYGTFGTVIRLFETIVKTGWIIFFVNLSLHFILRGLWIGSIGLRYVSQEIEYDDLNYSEKFTKYLRRKVGSYDDFIERLEKICSVLFAYTFLLFLFFVSLLIYFGWIGIGSNLLAKVIDNSKLMVITQSLVAIYILLGFIVFIDFMTLGGFKKIKDNRVASVYLVIYRFFSTITLSFLYRPLLYNFIDHKYTRRLFYFSIPYILGMIICQSLLKNQQYPHYPDRSMSDKFGISLQDKYYDDRRELVLAQMVDGEQKQSRNLVPMVSFKSFELDDKYSSLFIKLRPSDQDLLNNVMDIEPLKKAGFRLNFGSPNFEDSDKLALTEEMNQELAKKRKLLSPLYKERRKLRKEKKSVDFINEKLDSLDFELEETRKEWRKKLDDFDKEKLVKIKKAIKQNFTFEINSIDYKDSLQCYFYKHPNLDEKGLLCLFSTLSIEPGLGEFSVSRTFFRSSDNDSIRTNKVTLPFIKL